MATKAIKKPGTAVAKAKAKVPVSANLMAQIQEDIKAQAEMVQQSATNKVKMNSAQGKHYVFPDKTELPSFEGIVVDFATVQVLYDGPFVAGQINNIVCYAVATKPTDLAPLPEVLTPQAVECKTCMKSKFTPEGEKPECGLRKLLAILPVDADASTDILVIDLPVMAAKAWDKYAQSVLVSEGVPVYGVITKFGFDDKVKYDSPRFELVEGCDGDQAALAFSRRDEARRMLLSAPQINPVEDKPKGKAGATKKRAA